MLVVDTWRFVACQVTPTCPPLCLGNKWCHATTPRQAAVVAHPWCLAGLHPQGRSTWNAGRPHDEGTRAKMAEAKLGKPKPLATRKRMAAAALGHPVSAEVRAEVGERFRGQPKSAEHRSKLAAVARRRHAATRVLRAVEAVYAAASVAPMGGSTGAARNGGPGPVAAAAAGSGAAGASGGTASAASAGGSPPAGSSAGLGAAVPPGAVSSSSASSGSGAGGGPPNLGAVRAAAYSMGLTGLSDSKTGRRLSRTQILNTFKAELREYRALQVGAGGGLPACRPEGSAGCAHKTHSCAMQGWAWHGGSA